MVKSIVWKFVGVFSLLILTSVLILNFFAGIMLRNYFEQNISERLLSNAMLISNVLKDDIARKNQRNIQERINLFADNTESRITVLDERGVVLGDSEKDPTSMDNHSDRLEVIRALSEGTGESNRFSDTLAYNMKYVAMSVMNGDELVGVVRLALPLEEVESQIQVIYRSVLIGGLVAIAFVLIIGFFVSKSIITPISEMKEVAQTIAAGDFTKRASIRSDDELGVLAQSLNKMADELQLKMDNLKRMDSIRTDFVANVSHELKTPLTSIKGFIETLEDGALEDKENARRFLSIMRKNADWLSNITSDLLSLAELESGSQSIHKEELDLKIVLEEIAYGFVHAISEQSHDLKTDYKGKDFTIYANRVKVEQALVNIIDNAVKYTREGGSIRATLEETPDNVVFSVADNGIGIPEEHIDRVFERFYRVEKARSRQLGGTGLGLSIVKHVVMLHGGTIDIRSSAGKGTTVTLSFPKASIS